MKLTLRMMKNNNGTKLELNRKYAFNIADGSLFAYNDERINQLQYKHIDDLLPLLDGSRSEDEITDVLSVKDSFQNIYYVLELMRKKEFIIEHECPKGNMSEKEKLPELAVTSLSNYTSDIQKITESIPWEGKKSAAINWRERLETEWAKDKIWVLAVPNYLHPEIEEFNRTALRNKIKWLPYRPDNEMILAGPVFNNGLEGCFSCLKFYHKSHRLSSALLFEKFNSWNSVSINCNNETAAISGALVSLEIKKAISEKSTGYENEEDLNKGMISFSLKDNERKFHPFCRHMHCKECGTPLTISDSPEVCFVSHPKIGYNDGGCRIVEAKNSLEKFVHCISLYTSPIGDLAVRKDNDSGYYVAYSRFGTVKEVDPSSIDIKDFKNGRIRAMGASGGKGRTVEQARMSAIGEAFERYSTQFFGYEPYRMASWNEIKKERAISPKVLVPFSESQYKNREEWGKKNKFSFVPLPFDEQKPIAWSKTWSLTNNESVYIPTAYLFYQLAPELGGCYIHGDSNGVAGGNCLEEAFIQAFFEIIERDSAGMWWYNMTRHPALDLKKFNYPKTEQMSKMLDKEGYDLYALDLTTEFEIPAIVAIAWSRENNIPLMGLGAHFDVEIALDRAISEVGQSHPDLESQRPDDLKWWNDTLKQGTVEFLKPDNSKPLKRPQDFKNFSSDDFLTDIETVLKIMHNHGFEVIVHNLTRDGIGFSAIRVIVPGLIHFWPRFNSKRLYQAPVDMGRIIKPHSESELNQVPFPF